MIKTIKNNSKLAMLFSIILLVILSLSGCDGEIIDDNGQIIENTYTLTIEVEGGGSTYPEDDVREISDGEIVELEAIPDDGYDFIKWEGNVQDSENKETSILIEEDETITAVFEESTDSTEDPKINDIDINNDVQDISVDYGTSEDDATSQLIDEIIITDTDGNEHTVDLKWTIEDYDGNSAGNYSATGVFDLPEGVEQTEPETSLEVTANVIVKEDDSDVKDEKITKEIFASDEEMKINLGTMSENESAIIAISPLNIDPDNANIYDGILNIDYSDGSQSTQGLNNISTLSTQEISSQAKLDAELRRKENEYLSKDLKTVIDDRDEVHVQDTDYELGESRSFYNVQDNKIESELKVISDKALIYVADDIKDEISIESLDEIADAFDDNIHPTVMDNFAFYDEDYYDWDDNGKTTILIYDMDTFAGYFYSRDFYSKDDFEYSNEAEMFYINHEMITWVEDSDINYPMDNILSTVAHEYQHLMFFVNKHHSGRTLTDTWINEGFSMLAEYLTGYLDYNNYSFIYNDYGSNNDYYFNHPHKVSLMAWEQTTSDYGASALFALYLYDRLGEGIIEDIQTSNLAPEEVITNNYKDFSEIFLGGKLANYIDNQGIDLYSYSSVDLENKPSLAGTINGSFSDNISIKSTAVKYFEIKGNGSEVSLEIENMNEDTGVVIYRNEE